MIPAEVFIEQLPFVSRAVDAIARRRGLAAAERDDFRSWVHERLIVDDYRILRQFHGDSRIETYLTVVIKRLSLDYLDRLLGKWRPSAAAVRLGPVAVRLETLLIRDQQPFTQACQVLNAALPHPLSDAEIDAIRSELPNRTYRRVDGEDVLEVVSATRGADDTAFADGVLRATAAHARAALREALEALPAEDRLLVRLHFEDGWTIAQIARTLQVEQKPLYRRVGRILATLRASMTERGITATHLEGWVGTLPLDPEPPMGRETSPTGTSNG